MQQDTEHLLVRQSLTNTLTVDQSYIQWKKLRYASQNASAAFQGPSLSIQGAKTITFFHKYQNPINVHVHKTPVSPLLMNSSPT